MFSTPVSSMKAPRTLITKFKSTRFQLPSSGKKSHKTYDSVDSVQCHVQVCHHPFLNSICEFTNQIFVLFHVGAADVTHSFTACRWQYAKNETNTVSYTEIGASRSATVVRTYIGHTRLHQSRAIAIVRSNSISIAIASQNYWHSFCICFPVNNMDRLSIGGRWAYVCMNSWPEFHHSAMKHHKKFLITSCVAVSEWEVPYSTPEHFRSIRILFLFRCQTLNGLKTMKRYRPKRLMPSKDS